MRTRESVLGAFMMLFGLLSASPATESVTQPGVGTTKGILKDRLLPEQRQAWESIEGKVLAEHPTGGPLYPALRRLWDWANGTRHQIYIEMPTKAAAISPKAAQFRIEKFNAEAESYVAVIELNLAKIDEAGICPQGARSNGFIPFNRLSNEERYLEVFAHELAHALHWLTDSEYARLEREFDTEAAVHHQLLTAKMEKKDQRSALARCRARLASLVRQIEGPAEQTEEAIWKELIAARVR
jgi:hypothetical protein